MFIENCFFIFRFQRIVLFEKYIISFSSFWAVEQIIKQIPDILKNERNRVYPNLNIYIYFFHMSSLE